MFKEILLKKGGSLSLLEIPFKGVFTEGFERVQNLNILGSIPSLAILRRKSNGQQVICVEVTFEDELESSSEMIHVLMCTQKAGLCPSICALQNFSYQEENNTIQLFMLFQYGGTLLSKFLQTNCLVQNFSILDSLIFAYLQAFIEIDKLNIEFPLLCTEGTFIQIIGNSQILLLPQQLFRSEIELILGGELDLNESCISPEELNAIKSKQQNSNFSEISRSNEYHNLSKATFSLGILLLRILNSQPQYLKYLKGYEPPCQLNFYDKNEIRINFEEIDKVKSKISLQYPERITKLLDKLLIPTLPREHPTSLLNEYKSLQSRIDTIPGQLSSRRPSDLLSLNRQGSLPQKVFLLQTEENRQLLPQLTQKPDIYVSQSEILKLESENVLRQSFSALELSSITLDKLHINCDKKEEKQKLDYQTQIQEIKPYQYLNDIQLPIQKVDELLLDSDSKKKQDLFNNCWTNLNQNFSSFESQIKSSPYYPNTNSITKNTYPQDSSDSKYSSAAGTEAQGLSDSDGNGSGTSKFNSRKVNPLSDPFDLFSQVSSDNTHINKYINYGIQTESLQIKVLEQNDENKPATQQQNLVSIEANQLFNQENQQQQISSLNTPFSPAQINTNLTSEFNQPNEIKIQVTQSLFENDQLLLFTKQHSFQELPKSNSSSFIKSENDSEEQYSQKEGIQIDSDHSQFSNFADDIEHERGFKFPTDVIQIVDSCGGYDYDETQQQFYKNSQSQQQQLPSNKYSFQSSQHNNNQNQKSQFGSEKEQNCIQYSEIIPFGQQEKQEQQQDESQYSDIIPFGQQEQKEDGSSLYSEGNESHKGIQYSEIVPFGQQNEKNKQEEMQYSNIIPFGQQNQQPGDDQYSNSSEEQNQDGIQYSHIIPFDKQQKQESDCSQNESYFSLDRQNEIINTEIQQEVLNLFQNDRFSFYSQNEEGGQQYSQIIPFGQEEEMDEIAEDCLMYSNIVPFGQQQQQQQEESDDEGEGECQYSAIIPFGQQDQERQSNKSFQSRDSDNNDNSLNRIIRSQRKQNNLNNDSDQKTKSNQRGRQNNFINLLQNSSKFQQVQESNSTHSHSWINKESTFNRSDNFESPSSSGGSEWLQTQLKRIKGVEKSEDDKVSESQGYSEISIDSGKNSLIFESPIQNQLKMCIMKQEHNNQEFQAFKKKIKRPQNSLTSNPLEYDLASSEETEQKTNGLPAKNNYKNSYHFHSSSNSSFNLPSINSNMIISKLDTKQQALTGNVKEIQSIFCLHGQTAFPNQLLSSGSEIFAKNPLYLKEFSHLGNKDLILQEFLSEFEQLVDIRKIQYKNASYRGQVLKTNKAVKRHGLGFYQVENEHIYCGQFNDGFFNGTGTYLFKNGDIYKGEFSLGQRSGNGTYYYHQQEVIYKGEWKENKKEGRGKMYYSDKEWYQGEFEKNQKKGKGVYMFANGDAFEGEWRDKDIKAMGTLTLKDGIKMNGFLEEINSKDEVEQDAILNSPSSINLLNSIKNAQVKSIEFTQLESQIKGESIRYFRNGDKYEGTIVEGVRQGNGKYYYSNGGYYCGEWKNNMKEGKGKYIFSDGTTYEGEFLNSQKNGQGIQTFQNGEMYEGQWKDDQQNGYGNYTFSEGCSYSGEWSEGQIHGIGSYKITTVVGISEMKGIWKKGALVEMKIQ